MNLFDEDRNVCLDDMDWPVDSVFANGSPPGLGFELSNAAEEFLDGGPPLQNSSGMSLPSASEKRTNSHISPRGVTDNDDHDNTSHAANKSASNAKRASHEQPGTNHLRNGNELHNDVPDSNNQTAAEKGENQNLFQEDNSTRTSQEASPKREGTPVRKNSAERQIYVSEEAGGHAELSSIQKDEHSQQQIPNIGEEVDVSLATEIPFTVNLDSHELSGTGFDTADITNDPIESLVQLPDHVRFSGDLDPLLQLQPMGTAEANEETEQTFLQLPMQAPHQDLMTSIQPTQQVDLSSNILISTYEEPITFRTNPLSDPTTYGMSPFVDAPPFLQIRSAFPEQTDVRTSANALKYNEAIQGTQAYDNNVQHHLQLPLTTDYGSQEHPFMAAASSHLSSRSRILAHHALSQRYTASTTSIRGIPLPPTDGIQKKRGRKKGIRDPTKPPPTPRRRKAYTPRLRSGEQTLGLSGDAASGRSAGNYKQGSLIPNSTGSSASGPSQPLGAQLAGRAAMSIPECLRSSAADEMQPISGPRNSTNCLNIVSSGRPRAAIHKIAKVTSGVGVGRVAKKPGKRGGRINPETAHLSAEERRSLRAKRNRESAEKSRVRRKVQTAELEMSVAELREENKSLKGEMLRFQTQLSAMSVEVTQHGQSPAEQEQILREHTPALFHALVVMQRVINECPRTFRPLPHSPEIQLKIRR